MASPLYHDPSPRHPRSRRSSSRKSFAMPLSRSNSNLDSPKFTAGQDSISRQGDAEYLQPWLTDDALWAQLPAQLRSELAAMQHAGAAVLRSNARLHQHITENEDGVMDPKLPVDFMDFEKLPPPQFSPMSGTNSVFPYGIASPPATDSCSSTPRSASPVPSSVSSSQTLASPVSRGSPALETFAIPSPISRGRTFSVTAPLNPKDSYYAAELSHLRTEALPHLCHAARKVDMVWYGAKATGLSAEIVTAFENWWKEKKESITKFNEDCKRLSNEVGLVSNGMGWKAA